MSYYLFDLFVADALQVAYEMTVDSIGDLQVAWNLKKMRSRPYWNSISNGTRCYTERGAIPWSWR